MLPLEIIYNKDCMKNIGIVVQVKHLLFSELLWKHRLYNNARARISSSQAFTGPYNTNSYQTDQRIRKSQITRLKRFY
jgi:hypothetical protein